MLIHSALMFIYTTWNVQIIASLFTDQKNTEKLNQRIKKYIN